MRLNLGEGRMERDAGRSETDFGQIVSLRKSDGLAKPLLKQKEKRPPQGPHLGFAMCKWRRGWV